MKVGTEIGVGDDPALLRRIRAQGNFVEYVPLGLILLGLAEHRQVATALLWTIAALLVIGRALHAAGMLSGLTPVRAAGMVTTYGALLAGAGALVIQ
ncbi:MAPEG family protein [Sphingopyxis sp. NJF-3]